MLYRIAVISDSEKENKKLREVLSLYFPYHLIVENKTKFDIAAQKYAKTQRCGCTIVHAVSNDFIYKEFIKNNPDMFILFWDGDSDDMRYFVKKTHIDKIPTLIYYEEKIS